MSKKNMTKKISEGRLMREHLEEGSKRYGRRWDRANIGWGVGDLDIESKVYGKPALVFSSYVKAERIKHTEEKY